MTLQIDGETFIASVGDFVQIPNGVVHSFRNTGTRDAKMLVVNTPGGIESFYAEGFDPVTDLTSPPQPASPALMARIQAAAAKHGIETLVPPRPHQEDSRVLATHE